MVGSISTRAAADMIEQQGRVVRVSRTAAWVAVGGQSGCFACDAGRGCGAGIFGRLLRRKPLELAFDNPAGWPVGQAVTLGIPESVFLGLILRWYALPLVAGLVGAVICHHISGLYGVSKGGSDLFTLAGLLAGIAASMPWRHDGHRARALQRHLHLVKRVDGRNCAGERVRTRSEPV